MTTKLVNLIDSALIEACLTDIILAKMEVDSNNFGGVMLERDLAQALRVAGHYVYTQRQIETLQTAGCLFDFGVDFSTFKRNQKDIRESVYGADLFLFDKQEDVFVLIDCLSLKTSINDHDGSPVFIVNDAEGVIYDSYLRGETDFNIGSVLFVCLNTKNGKFNVSFFNDTVESITSVFAKDETDADKVSFNLKDSVVKGKSRKVVTIVNRNNPNNQKKQTSFNRGFQVRRDFIPTLCDLGVFRKVCEGTVIDQTNTLVDRLLKV